MHTKKPGLSALLQRDESQTGHLPMTRTATTPQFGRGENCLYIRERQFPPDSQFLLMILPVSQQLTLLKPVKNRSLCLC